MARITTSTNRSISVEPAQCGGLLLTIRADRADGTTILLSKSQARDVADEIRAWLDVKDIGQPG